MEETLTEKEPSADYLKVEMIVTARCVECDNTDCAHALAKAERVGDELIRYARLKDAVCEAAKVELEAHNAPGTFGWTSRLYAARRKLRSADQQCPP